MRSLIILPILLFGMLLQTTVFASLSLISGKADILLLILVSWNINKDDNAYILWAIFAGSVFAFYSSTPWFVPFLGYILVSLITRKIKSMTFHLPIFLLIFSTLLSSSAFLSLFLAQIWIFSGFEADITTMFWSITIPSLFLNLILILPVNSIVHEFVKIADPRVDLA